MGLFQNLLETYDKCSTAVGIVSVEEDGSTDERKTLLPVFHTTFKSEISVTIDLSGRFVNARRDMRETTIIIPCTESSAGRASGIAAHPLCDQIDYVGGINKSKTEAYLDGLGAWKNNNEVLEAIFEYVSRETMIKDLIRENLFKENEYIESKSASSVKQIDGEKVRKIGIRFAIQYDDRIEKVWESASLRNEWINHLLEADNHSEELFDYLSGEPVSQIAAQHPKNINSYTGNAKLLSCNDTSGFTFRGRFAKKDDAVIVDYYQSQKMHQMLRWLIANYGYAIDSQVIVTWAVDSDTEVKVKVNENSFDVFLGLQEVQTDADVLAEANTYIYADYSRKLKGLLQGYGKTDYIKQHARTICIAIFDAATTGRMGLLFYQEFPENTYLENIVAWHNDTSYYLTAWKKEKDERGRDKSTLIRFVGAPSYDDILFAMYGKPRGDKSYDILRKRIRKQLLECMFGDFAFPKSMVDMAASQSSRPQAFTDSNGRFSEYEWERSVNITCALARKYYKEQKEEIQLELDVNRTDRDYLFGRLLSVADRLEGSALYKADKQGTRTTNAVRLMSAYQVKPYSTWGQLFNQLIPYKNQLNGAGYYQSIIDSIMVLFEEGDFENNSPLSPLYLLGFSAQNRALSRKNVTVENLEENENEDPTE
ncbi:MAG: type I-C CRISPR-associated protein Cas8c/Csd1 [Anaerovoracaceae bacterium]|jgi:CRISPR-associated protein Csd1